MDLYNSLMNATDSVDGNISAYFSGKDAEILREMHSDDVPEMGRCECGMTAPVKYLEINGGACFICVSGKKDGKNDTRT